MKSLIYISVFLLAGGIVFSGCGPKEVETEAAELSFNSQAWIPFDGNETVTFVSDEDTMVFEGSGRITYFDNVRYMSDQSGFLNVQEDYYAPLQRQELIMESTSSKYFIRYFLEKNMGETGEWDMIHITLADGDYYTNEIRKVVFETDKFPKAESFEYKSTVKLNGITYRQVYYLKQERRPFELYYSKEQGVVAFKLSANKLYTVL